MTDTIENPISLDFMLEDGGASFGAALAFSAAISAVLKASTDYEVRANSHQIKLLWSALKEQETRYNNYLNDLVHQSIKSKVYSMADAIKLWVDGDEDNSVIIGGLQTVLEVQRDLHALAVNQPDYVSDTTMIALEELHLVNFYHLKMISAVSNNGNQIINSSSKRLIETMDLLQLRAIETLSRNYKRRVSECSGPEEGEQGSGSPKIWQRWGFSVDRGMCRDVTVAQHDEIVYFRIEVKKARKRVQIAVDNWISDEVTSERGDLDRIIKDIKEYLRDIDA
ncbi:hypothetical protein [Roseibium sp.]|uniref:hypothetical protein n=1 Tax=Roseibium sp. TaxID=1936156 RepID=UPI003B510CB6